MRFAFGLFVLTAALAPAGVDAQACDRLPRDCDGEARAFEARARRLQGLSDPVQAGVDALKLRRRAACLEWNACALEDAELQQLHRWADGELQTLARANDEAARNAWARGLAQRGRAAMAPSAGTPSASTFRPPLSPQVVESILRLQDEVEALEAFRPIVIRIQRGAVVRNHREPPICDTDTRSELRTLVRSGNSLVRTDARELLQGLDDLCEPFEHWENPPETVQLRLTRFGSQIERIEGWLTEIIRCVRPGPYDGRCRNAYGPQTPQTLPDARRAMGELNRVKALLRRHRNRPFPCHDALWDRLERSQWSLRTAEAQIPGLARDARRLCELIGVVGDDLPGAEEEIREDTERDVASIAQYLASRRQALRQLRDVYGDQLPPDLR